MTLTVNIQRDRGLDVDGLRELLDESIRVTEAFDDTVQVLVDGEPSDDVLESLPNLNTVIVPYSGLSGRTRKRLLARPGVAAYNLHHNATIVAELTLGLLLAAAKQLPRADGALRQGDWRMRYDDGNSMLLDGKTAVIVGYGAIGRRSAQLLLALGMNVIGIRRGAGGRDGKVEVRPGSELRRSLEKAQVVIVAVPKTPATTGLIGAEELAALPTDAILVNVARGPVVDEAALYDALKSRRLFGAALDVWYQYPFDEGARATTLPSTLPFHELDNVVLSPHRGGNARDTERMRTEHLARVLNQLARGAEPDSRVDLEAGY